MGEHRAERLPVECPICHREIAGDLGGHLESAHSRAELVDHLLALWVAEEETSMA